MSKKQKKLSERAPLEIIEDLQVMQATVGWAIILEMIEANIETLNNMILNKTEDGKPEGKQIDDHEVDLLRFKRGYLLDLKNIPQNMIDKLSDEDAEPENFDPYFKDAKEIIAERRKQKSK